MMSDYKRNIQSTKELTLKEIASIKKDMMKKALQTAEVQTTKKQNAQKKTLLQTLQSIQLPVGVASIADLDIGEYVYAKLEQTMNTISPEDRKLYRDIVQAFVEKQQQAQQNIQSSLQTSYQNTSISLQNRPTSVLNMLPNNKISKKNKTAVNAQTISSKNNSTIEEQRDFKGTTNQKNTLNSIKPKVIDKNKSSGISVLSDIQSNAATEKSIQNTPYTLTADETENAEVETEKEIPYLSHIQARYSSVKIKRALDWNTRLKKHSGIRSLYTRNPHFEAMMLSLMCEFTSEGQFDALNSYATRYSNPVEFLKYLNTDSRLSALQSALPLIKRQFSSLWEDIIRASQSMGVYNLHTLEKMKQDEVTPEKFEYFLGEVRSTDSEIEQAEVERLEPEKQENDISIEFAVNVSDENQQAQSKLEDRISYQDQDQDQDRRYSRLHENEMYEETGIKDLETEDLTTTENEISAEEPDLLLIRVKQLNALRKKEQGITEEYAKGESEPDIFEDVQDITALLNAELEDTQQSIDVILQWKLLQKKYGFLNDMALNLQVRYPKLYDLIIEFIAYNLSQGMDGNSVMVLVCKNIHRIMQTTEFDQNSILYKLYAAFVEMGQQFGDFTTLILQVIQHNTDQKRTNSILETHKQDENTEEETESSYRDEEAEIAELDDNSLEYEQLDEKLNFAEYIDQELLGMINEQVHAVLEGIDTLKRDVFWEHEDMQTLFEQLQEAFDEEQLAYAMQYIEQLLFEHQHNQLNQEIPLEHERAEESIIEEQPEQITNNEEAQSEEVFDISEYVDQDMSDMIRNHVETLLTDINNLTLEEMWEHKDMQTLYRYLEEILDAEQLAYAIQYIEHLLAHMQNNQEMEAPELEYTKAEERSIEVQLEQETNEESIDAQESDSGEIFDISKYLEQDTIDMIYTHVQSLLDETIDGIEEYFWKHEDIQILITQITEGLDESEREYAIQYIEQIVTQWQKSQQAQLTETQEIEDTLNEEEKPQDTPDGEPQFDGHVMVERMKVMEAEGILTLDMYYVSEIPEEKLQEEEDICDNILETELTEEFWESFEESFIDNLQSENFFEIQPENLLQEAQITSLLLDEGESIDDVPERVRTFIYDIYKIIHTVKQHHPQYLQAAEQTKSLKDLLSALIQGLTMYELEQLLNMIKQTNQDPLILLCLLREALNQYHSDHATSILLLLCEKHQSLAQFIHLFHKYMSHLGRPYQCYDISNELQTLYLFDRKYVVNAMLDTYFSSIIEDYSTLYFSYKMSGNKDKIMCGISNSIVLEEKKVLYDLFQTYMIR